MTYTQATSYEELLKQWVRAKGDLEVASVALDDALAAISRVAAERDSWRRRALMGLGLAIGAWVVLGVVEVMRIW